MITFELSVCFNGDAASADEVERIVGLERVASGAGFGSRDVHFASPTYLGPTAIAELKERLVKEIGEENLYHVGCEAWDDEDEDGDNHDELNERFEKEAVGADGRRGEAAAMSTEPEDIEAITERYRSFFNVQPPERHSYIQITEFVLDDITTLISFAEDGGADLLDDAKAAAERLKHFVDPVGLERHDYADIADAADFEAEGLIGNDGSQLWVRGVYELHLGKDGYWNLSDNGLGPEGFVGKQGNDAQTLTTALMVLP